MFGARSNLFGKRDLSPQPHRRNPPSGFGGDIDTNVNTGFDPPQGTGHGNQPAPPQRGMPARQGMGHQQSSRGGFTGQLLHLQPTKSPDNIYIFTNIVAVSSLDVPPSQDGTDVFLLLNNRYVVSARPIDQFPRGQIGLSTIQREWMSIALTDQVQAEPYDLFSQGGQAYLGSADIEIGFAGKKTTESRYDQDELAENVTKIFANQIFAPGQRFMLDNKSIPMALTIKTVQLVNLSGKTTDAPTTADPSARGLLIPETQINFFRDPKSPINLKASNRRPPTTSIISPDFKFEEMGIGGLDAEFSTIFRRAFASRIMPPAIIEKLGIDHVRGLLLFGPPGTGKTLIARQIGKMLNSREPKIINGPEVLNKYVGQSEENIRKLFADAEKEYKEKGNESALHIIIFDELDAVCKQRGSGAGGGTGVGDSVVNQLLSKLDGVDQLNNVLLIGMTNRKDMIDDALLRPGRLEVHVEISLPDEAGRAQILKIHTQNMRNNKVMASDVDLLELAHQTKNFSGAEISGLVKSASSFAFQRHSKVGTMAGVRDDVVNMKVNRADFAKALEDVQPAFGVSEEELTNCLRGGIIHYSSAIKETLEEGSLYVKQVRQKDSTPLFSVVLHGAAGSGKTALAAKMAMDSDYPFIRLISPEDMIGLNESQKISHLSKVFMDAYKSPMSIVVIDSIEHIMEWNPIGPRFSNPIVLNLVSFLRKQPPKGRKLLIFATTSEQTVLKQIAMWDSFNADIAVPTLKTFDELAFVMTASAVFPRQDVRRALDEIRDITDFRYTNVEVGIKKILLGIETARQDGDLVDRFASIIGKAMQERTPDRSNEEATEARHQNSTARN